MDNKKRLQFDFTPEMVELLDELAEKTDSSTRAEALRKALRFYEWLIDYVDRDSVIEITNESGEVQAKIRASLLMK